MTSTNSSIPQKLLQLGQAYTALFESELGHFPLVEKDEDWPSPCELQAFDEQLIQWQPVKQTSSHSFENIEEALSIELHTDIATYFTAMYSEAIQVECEDGHLSLLFAWSAEDFERLQQNIIGHIMMKQKLKQSLTIFFAVTDQEDLILSVKNDSGEVWVERVGCEPHKKVADSLSDFIDMLTPYVENPQE